MMCNLTLSSILQKPNKTPLQSARIHYVKSRLERVRIESVFFHCMSQSIKMH